MCDSIRIQHHHRWHSCDWNFDELATRGVTVAHSTIRIIGQWSGVSLCSSARCGGNQWSIALWIDIVTKPIGCLDRCAVEMHWNVV